MEGGFTESTKAEPSWSKEEASSNNNNNSNEAGDFECNICFELAQDPIVTLCGHLYCWPCLYRWLHYHSQSQECPVCKALIEEDKLVPLYGRGKTTTDPRTRPIPGVEIPNRPSGQRPETAPPRPGPETNYFSNLGANLGLGLLGGFMPMGTARFGNTAVSAGFFGFFPSFSFQFNGFPHNTMYGGAPQGFPYGFPQTVHGYGHGHAHGDFPQQHHHHHGGVATQNYDSLVKLLFIIGIFVVLALGVW